MLGKHYFVTQKIQIKVNKLNVYYELGNNKIFKTINNVVHTLENSKPEPNSGSKTLSLDLNP